MFSSLPLPLFLSLSPITHHSSLIIIILSDLGSSPRWTSYLHRGLSQGGISSGPISLLLVHLVQNDLSFMSHSWCCTGCGTWNWENRSSCHLCGQTPNASSGSSWVQVVSVGLRTVPSTFHRSCARAVQEGSELPNDGSLVRIRFGEEITHLGLVQHSLIAHRVCEQLLGLSDYSVKSILGVS